MTGLLVLVYTLRVVRIGGGHKAVRIHQTEANNGRGHDWTVSTGVQVTGSQDRGWP